MPKSKRSKVVHLTQVNKKTREDKEELFNKIRAYIVEFAHCFVFSVNNMRNNHLKDVRREMQDSRVCFGKTKLMARALGHSPEDEPAPNIAQLSSFLTGTVGLIFTNRTPEAVLSYFDSLNAVDFARAGFVSTRSFSIPPGLVYSTAGEVPKERDVPLSHTMEPELRKLGVPVRILQGSVVLGGNEFGEGSEGYIVCREGDILDSRQTRLLKIFSVCMAEFRINVLAYWSAASEQVTEVNTDRADIH